VSRIFIRRELCGLSPESWISVTLSQAQTPLTTRDVEVATTVRC
jgi:hypothetical protein